eukprot:SAG31_NODE_517_length_14689_cov_5.110487_4_plen_90_part_00
MYGRRTKFSTIIEMPVLRQVRSMDWRAAARCELPPAGPRAFDSFDSLSRVRYDTCRRLSRARRRQLGLGGPIGNIKAKRPQWNLPANPQ